MEIYVPDMYQENIYKINYDTLLVTALIAAFIPGASPPDVRTPIVFILVIAINLYLYICISLQI